MKQLGVILALCCAIAWAFWGIFGKLSANRGMPPTTLAFVSSCVSFIVVVCSYAWQRFLAAPSPAGTLLAMLQCPLSRREHRRQDKGVKHGKRWHTAWRSTPPHLCQEYTMQLPPPDPDPVCEDLLQDLPAATIAMAYAFKAFTRARPIT